MVRLGVLFATFARGNKEAWFRYPVHQKKLKRRPAGLHEVNPYISPENNAGIWHGSGVKTGYIETFSKKK